MTISNRNIVEKQPVVIDPDFFLPPNVIDVRYINDQDTAGLWGDPSPEDGEVAVDEDVSVIIDEGVTDTGTVVNAPTTMQVIRQVVRVAPDGRFVVDVEIEVEDVPGVANYEVRLTKV